ncbi:hypothetical protein Trydic_g9768 [Trypoxylus dichotomus]
MSEEERLPSDHADNIPESQPPDGGYGWIVVAAVVLLNSSLIPIILCFGMIYEDKFSEMDIPASQISFLLHLNNSLMCLLGIFSGPLLKLFQHRPIIFAGVILCCVSIFLTTFAESYTFIMCTIGIMLGIGNGILMPATYMVVNSYFKERLTLAMSFQVTGSSIAGIFMPQICDFLLATFGITGTVLIFAGISFNAIPAAILLIPAKEIACDGIKKPTITAQEEKIGGEKATEKLLPVYNNTTIPINPESRAKRLLKSIGRLFNFELFSDRIYVIIVIGMGISFASELNTILMTSFVLKELNGFTLKELASATSLLSLSDVTGRLLLPYLAYKRKFSPKLSYILALVGSTIGRTVLSIFHNSKTIVLVSVAILGLGKGAKAVFQSLILPKYVSYDKLASANGLLMVINGILSLIVGPIIGVMHDVGNSYLYSLHSAIFPGGKSGRFFVASSFSEIEEPLLHKINFKEHNNLIPRIMAQNGKADTKFYIGAEPRRKRLRVGDPDFAPPDGGWGWLVVFACGFSNLSTYPMLQQFGLIFREKYNALGITNTEMTTIFNLNSAATACIGLFNGPVFRKLSFRQYALLGTTTVVISLFLTTFARSFIAYVILYAILYGGGLGIAQTSNALALNTYFREKRRVATGLSWTTTGIGPILCPYVITFLMNRYGMEGTLSLFAAFAGNAIVCSLLLQPVHWHTKFREEDDIAKALVNGKDSKNMESGYFENKLPKSNQSRSLFSSQYFSNDDERYAAAFDMVDPGTPMMIYANDGYYSRKSSFGSKMSLASNKGTRSKLPSGQNSVTISNRPSYSNLADARKRKQSKSKQMIQENEAEDCPTEKAPQDLKEEEKALLSKIETPVPNVYPNERDVLKSAAKKLTRYKEYKEIQALKLEEEKEARQEISHKEEEEKEEKEKDIEKEEEDKEYTFMQKVIMFFDLTLLKDYVYVNLMLGINIANFVELNFSILTPFVLKEFHFENFQIATFMSLLGATDVVCRFFIPFIADRMSWQNRSFFLLGVCSMAVGRIILIHTQTYEWSILVALIIGFGKGLRTVFIALVIPSHVSLDKLPAASGLQLVTSGILFFLMGPVVGWIRDTVKDYVITLHILNILTYATAIAWLTEKYLTDKRKKHFTKEIDTPKS